MSKRHLDIGCGAYPRNPFHQDTVFGVDLGFYESDVEIRQANLAIEPIPFNDNFFDSVSAFDFLEHIPRQTLDYAAGQVRFPFIELMQEVWRVLKPGGQFYALTPAYPAAEAFQDPTHVNIITPVTHSYFCGDDPHAARYGFSGRFQEHRVEFVVNKDAYEAEDNLGKRLRRLHRRYLKGGLTHLLWVLEARK